MTILELKRGDIRTLLDNNIVLVEDLLGQQERVLSLLPRQNAERFDRPGQEPLRLTPNSVISETAHILSRMKVCIVLGTRPENSVKTAPLVRACQRRGVEFILIHTGQHYSYEMDRIFFQDLELPDPQYNLNVGSGTHGKQTGAILVAIEKVLLDEKPNSILVQGDTNTVLAGALAAVKLNIPIGHVEAGLRSYDRQMPRRSTGSWPTISPICSSLLPRSRGRTCLRRELTQPRSMSWATRWWMPCCRTWRYPTVEARP